MTYEKQKKYLPLTFIRIGMALRNRGWQTSQNLADETGYSIKTIPPAICALRKRYGDRIQSRNGYGYMFNDKK